MYVDGDSRPDGKVKLRSKLINLEDLWYARTSKTRPL